MLEHIFEKALWSTRFIVIIAVVLSIMSSITLFLLGGWDIIHATLFNNPLINESVTNNNDLLFKIILDLHMPECRSILSALVWEALQYFHTYTHLHIILEINAHLHTPPNNNVVFGDSTSGPKSCIGKIRSIVVTPVLS